MYAHCCTLTACILWSLFCSRSPLYTRSLLHAYCCALAPIPSLHALLLCVHYYQHFNVQINFDFLQIYPFICWYYKWTKRWAILSCSHRWQTHTTIINGRSLFNFQKLVTYTYIRMTFFCWCVTEHVVLKKKAMLLALGGITLQRKNQCLTSQKKCTPTSRRRQLD